MHIRDPIHGTIEITSAERQVIDSRAFQRLRHIKQLGFADLAFPGATHSRYSHGIGAMHVATRLFDAIYTQITVPEADRERLRQTLRLAVLLHDLGHPPLSHTSERILPPRALVGLPGWCGDGEGEQASHEDMTLLLLLRSGLSDILRSEFAPLGIVPEHVASLVCGRSPDAGSPFVVAGTDHGPMLRQLVSSELDADRMDYLLRDSFFTGVHYGRYDLDWLVQNVMPIGLEGSFVLGLAHRAVMAFEDFLLSRYHMFLGVYYHSTSINFEQLLGRYYDENPGEFSLSAEPDAYIDADDVQLLSTLRRSSSQWARRIVERRPYHLLIETDPFEDGIDLSPIVANLGAEGIDCFQVESQGRLSKYFGTGHTGTPILVKTARGQHQRIDEYSPVFKRYAASAKLLRVYVDPDRRDRARALAGSLARR